MLNYVDGRQHEEEPQRSDSPTFYDEQSKYVPFHHRMLLNRPAKFLVVLAMFSIIGPILIYYFIFSASIPEIPPSDGLSVGSCVLPMTHRIPCGSPQRHQCSDQCCLSEDGSACFHRLPSRYSYILESMSSDVFTNTMTPRIAVEPYSSRQSLSNLSLAIDEISTTHLIINLYDSTKHITSSRRVENKTYSYDIHSPEMSIRVSSENRTLLDTALGPVIATDDLWEMSLMLTNDTMYGLGEIPLSYGMRKNIYANGKNAQSHPLIYAHSENGVFHGVFLESKGAIELEILESNLVILRSLSRNFLRVHVSTGPSPNDVLRDFASYLGNTFDIPYWALGIHHCRDSLSSINEAAQELHTLLEQSSEGQIPMDSHCGASSIELGVTLNDDEIEVMENSITALSAENKIFIPKIYPYIRYNATLTPSDMFVSDPTNFMEPYIGTVSGNKVLYPDYTNMDAIDLIKRLWPLSNYTSSFIFENNWPLDENEKNAVIIAEQLPYFNEYFEAVFNDTLPWDVEHNDGELHLHRHNTYGSDQMAAFQMITADFTKSTFTSSSSPSLSDGAGYRRQNVEVSWSSFHQELISAALGSVTGRYLWNTPVCGDGEFFDVVAHENLCLNWYTAYQFLPQLEIHSRGVNSPNRHPLTFNGTVRNIMVQTLQNRYRLLPYFYTTISDGPLLRPLFFEYPNEANVRNVNTQFAVGQALLIAPKLLPAQTQVLVTLPAGTWYELWGGVKFGNNSSSTIITMPTTESDSPTLLRGGYILPLQYDTQLTAVTTRLMSPYTFYIGLSCTQPQSSCSATGTVKISEGMIWNLEANNNSLTVTNLGDDFDSYCNFENSASELVTIGNVEIIRVYGLHSLLNNYDTFYAKTRLGIDLCDLKHVDSIVINYFN